MIILLYVTLSWLLYLVMACATVMLWSKVFYYNPSYFGHGERMLMLYVMCVMVWWLLLPFAVFICVMRVVEKHVL